MRLSDICIERPVLTTVFSLVLILMGVLGFQQLELRAHPKVFRPSLHVMVQVDGSSAEFVENNVVIPLENRLQDVDNLSRMRSQSTQGFAEITLHFSNISQADFLSSQSQVLQAVSQVKLPDNAEQPQIRMAGSHGDQLMLIGLSSTGMSQQALVDYAQNKIVRRLQQVPGVGTVQQWSTRVALRINLLPAAMAQLNISIQQIINALKDNNVSIPAGQVVNAEQTISINLQTKLQSVDAFKQLIISQQGNHYIRLKDIANIAIDKISYAGAYTYLNKQQGVAINIVPADNANPISLGKRLRHQLQQMQLSMPPGMSYNILVDQSKLIEQSVDEVFWTIFESIILVAFVTLLFLGRWRFALIPVVTIPVCIIATFAIMWLLGFSINLMTLLALVLAVGLVVDDAIVVLENCHRYVENGESPWKAAFHSMRQITFPVIGMTISIVAVYIPVMFMKGKTAVYFQQFAFTMAGAVLISGFVALTLTPMMCARLMSKVGETGYDAMLERFFHALRRHYQGVLTWTLKHRWLPIVLFCIFAGIGAWVFTRLPNTLLPKEYGGYVFVGVSLPDSASIAYTEKVHKKIINQLLAMPEVDNIMSFAGGTGNAGNLGFSYLHLKPAWQNAKQNQAVAQAISKKFAHLTNAQVFAVPVNVNGERGGDSGAEEGQIEYHIVGYAGYPQLINEARNFTRALNATGEFQQVDNDLRFSSQQYDITINRQKAQQLGLTTSDVNTTLSTLLGGYTISDGYQFAGVNYPVILQLPVQNMTDLQVLNNIYLTNHDGAKIAINRVVDSKPVIALPARVHINGMRSGNIVVTAKLGQTPGQVTKTVEQVAKQVFSPGISLSFSQKIADMIEGNSRMMLIFLLGLIFIYLVFGALFESFIDPLIILFTVPLCIVGALIMLKIVGGSINIYTSIGLVTLIGLVSKHGVLITQFANQSREAGKSIHDSVVEAASIRIRPILMTTATMVMGALPLLFVSGVGSNSRGQIGWVIIAGLLVGTLFSLFLVPVAYTLLARFKRPLRKKKNHS